MIDNLEPKPDMWEANPKLKMLSLVFIFVFLFSGITLVMFSVWSNQYRQKIYEETQNSLPKHEVSKSASQQISDSEIKDWITYKNDQYGFEINYPTDWTIKQEKDGLIFICEKTSKCQLAEEGYESTIWITVSKNDPGIVLNKNGNNFKTLGDFLVSSKTTETIDFNGTRGYYLEPEGRGISGSAFIIKDNQVFQFSSESLIPEEFKKILSTFKFTKSLDTSNWQAYTNEQYGFEFMHPADFVLQSGLAEGFIALTKGPDTIGTQVLNKKFDPKKIENLGGIVEDAKQVKVGDQIGYMYGNGDGPWMSSEVETVLGNKTLRIGFQSYVNEGSSPDGVGVLYEDNILINKILSTFKFTK